MAAARTTSTADTLQYPALTAPEEALGPRPTTMFTNYCEVFDFYYLVQSQLVLELLNSPWSQKIACLFRQTLGVLHQSGSSMFRCTLYDAQHNTRCVTLSIIQCAPQEHATARLVQPAAAHTVTSSPITDQGSHFRHVVQHQPVQSVVTP